MKERIQQVMISAKLVKELRDSTGAGMMDCKNALQEANGDINKANEILRKKGIAKAAKKSDRTANEGSISIKIDENLKKASIIELNSETDFVAKNENFIKLLEQLLNHIHNNELKDLNEINIDGLKFNEYLNNQIAKIGEKIDLRRFQTLKASRNDLVNGYIHSNNKIGVLVHIKVDNEELAKSLGTISKEIAMHIAAMKPLYLDEKDIPADIIEKERQIAKEQLLNEGKDKAIIDKIVPGKIKKFIAENTLLNQKFVKDDKISVADALNNSVKSLNGKAEIIDFIRFELGEGIEKKSQDFASEVAAQLG